LPLLAFLLGALSYSQQTAENRGFAEILREPLTDGVRMRNGLKGIRRK